MNKIMTHVVAGYPSYDSCIELLRGMEAAGVSLVEVQIPFSDPIADGETIMQANDTALKNNMTIKKSFELIKAANLKIDVYVMSYFQKIFSYDIDKFCELAAYSGAVGLIVPDLTYDAPEFIELKSLARKYNLSLIPVISPGISSNRLEQSLANVDELVYLTSVKGITGKSLKVKHDLITTAENIKKINPNILLAIGFGIASKKDLKEILKIADIGVVGSVVIRKIDTDGVDEAIKFVHELVSF